MIAAALACVPALAQTPDRQQIEQKLEQARQAMASRDYPRAVELYREVRELIPLPGVRMNLGIAYFMAGQYRSALDELALAVGEDPELTPGWLFVGASHLQLGQFSRAIEPLQRYLEKSPEDPRARQMLGDALLQSERPGEAAQHFEKLTRLRPQDPQPWFSLGRSYEALAQQGFQKLEGAAPESALWLALVAESRLAAQQYQSAFYLYRRALEKRPRTRGVHVAISRIYEATGHPEWARAELEKEKALGTPDCEREPLVCHFLEGRHREILSAVQGRDTAESYYWLSRAANQLAVEAFGKLAELPSSFEMHQLLAEIYSTRGRHQDAAGQWKQVLKLSPGHPVARQQLALSLFLSRDYEAARPLVEELVEQSPQSAQLNFLAGELELSRQRADEAVPLLEKALELDPNLAPARASLGRALLELGRFEEAVPHLEASLESDADGSIHFQLARAYMSTGREEQAGRTLARHQEIQRRLQSQGAQLDEEIRITPPN